MAQAVTLTVRGFLVPGLNVLMRTHWRERGRIRERVDGHLFASLHALPKVPKEFGCPVSIHFTRYYARSPLDLDNLAAAGKFVLDAIVRLHLLKDDNPNVVREYHCDQVKVATEKEQGFDVTITKIA